MTISNARYAWLRMVFVLALLPLLSFKYRFGAKERYLSLKVSDCGVKGVSGGFAHRGKAINGPHTLEESYYCLKLVKSNGNVISSEITPLSFSLNSFYPVIKHKWKMYQ